MAQTVNITRSEVLKFWKACIAKYSHLKDLNAEKETDVTMALLKHMAADVKVHHKQELLDGIDKLFEVDLIDFVGRKTVKDAEDLFEQFFVTEIANTGTFKDWVRDTLKRFDNGQMGDTIQSWFYSMVDAANDFISGEETTPKKQYAEPNVNQTPEKDLSPKKKEYIEPSNILPKWVVEADNTISSAVQTLKDSVFYNKPEANPSRRDLKNDDRETSGSSFPFGIINYLKEKAAGRGID